MKRPTLTEAKTFFYQNAPFVMDEYEDMKQDYGEFFAARYIIEILIDKIIPTENIYILK